MRKFYPQVYRRNLLFLCPKFLFSFVLAALYSFSVFAQNPTPPNLGTAASFGLLSGTSISSNTNVRVFGAAGAVSSISSALTADSSKFSNNSNPVPAALSALTTARTYCNSLSSSSINTALNGQTLNQGVYAVSGNATLSSASPFTLVGDTNSVFIFNISGDLAIQADARVILDGVLPENIFWNSSGSVSIGGNVNFNGVILSQGQVDKQGLHFGSSAFLSSSAINLTDLDFAVGHNSFISLNYLQSFPNNRFTAPDLACLDEPACPMDVVRNGGFEIKLNHVDWLHNMGAGAPLLRSPCSWKDGNSGTSDHFYTNYTAGGAIAGVSANMFGNMQSISDGVLGVGQGYAGLTAYTPISMYREYIMHEIPLLETGKWYYGEFWVSLAANSLHAVAELGMWISSDHPNPTVALTGTTDILRDISNDPITPNIINTNGILNNSGTWTRISGPYLANGTERFITIGNFADSPSVASNSITTASFNSAYYYIDDVSLSLLPDAGPDVSICTGQSVTLGSGNTCGLPNGTVLSWSTPSGFIATGPNITVSPSATTTYTLSITGPGFTNVFSTATVTINQLNMVVTAMCNDDGTTTFTAMEGSSYSWSGPGITSFNPQTGSTFTTIPPNLQGTFTVTDLALPGSCLLLISTDPCCNRPYEVLPATVPGFLYPETGIGDPFNLTILDGDEFGQDIYFSGTYHVKGPLKLINGNFFITPGTIFYMDGQVTWSDPVCQNALNFASNFNLNYIQVDQDARLVIEGATITASCDHMWEGIRLTNGGIIETNEGNGQYSEISDAVCGIRSFDTNDCNGYNNNQYTLNRTNFLRCHSGLIDYNKDADFSFLGTGIRGCYFNPNGMLSPFDTSVDPDSRGFAGVFLFHDPGLDRSGYFDKVTFEGNTFEHFGFTGFGGQGRFVTLNGNTFLDNFETAINVQTDSEAMLGTDNTYLFNNIIVLPTANPNHPTLQVIGIMAYWNCLMLGNEIRGQFPAISNVNGDRNIGVLGLEERVMVGHSSYTPQTPNVFRNLDHAVRMQIYDWDNYVTNNEFIDNRKGIVIAPSTPVKQDIEIYCNTFSSTNNPQVSSITLTGIEVEPGSGLVDQGNCSGVVTGNEFNFQGTNWKSLESLAIDPTLYNHGLNENPFAGNVFGNFQLFQCSTTTSACSSLGLANGVGRVAGTDSIAIAEMMDSLRLQVGTPQDFAYYERMIIDYHVSNGYVTGLQAYANTLPAYNVTAYNHLGLYLLRHYRRHGNAAAEQQIRTQLLVNNAGNTEMEYEIKFFDLQARLGRLLLGNGVTLSATDSAGLADVAASGTVHWLQACHAIRYYHPQTVCNSGYNIRMQQAGKGNTNTWLGLAYPNPAENTVTVPYTLPKGTINATLRIAEIATGRLVQSVALDLNAETVEVKLDNLSSGLYTYTLLLDGVPNATKKLVVIK